MCAWALRIVPMARAGILVGVFSLKIEPGHEVHGKKAALRKPLRMLYQTIQNQSIVRPHDPNRGEVPRRSPDAKSAASAVSVSRRQKRRHRCPNTRPDTFLDTPATPASLLN